MPKPITDVMRQLQGGAFVQECTDKLAEIVKGVDETGKAGRLTITLDLKKVGGALSVLAKCTDKTPEEGADPDLFYATPEGNLSLNNPNQRQLDLRDAGGKPREIRDADPVTGEIRGAS